MSDNKRRLPYRINCSEYVMTVAVTDRHTLESRVHIDDDTGRMCDFHMRITDIYTHQELLSADCEHGTAHYHDERNGHENSKKYDFAPATSHDEIEAANDLALETIVSFARSKGMII